MKGYLKYLAFIGLIIVIILWIGGFFRTKIKSEVVQLNAQKVSGLKVGTVEEKEVSDVVYVGIVEADEEAEIATPLSGIVTSIMVKEGDCVKKGSILLTIDSESIQAQKESVTYSIKGAEAEYGAAKANFEAAKKTYERYTILLKEGAVTPQEYDEVKARYEGAKEALEKARSQIASLEAQKRAIQSQFKYLILRAPFSGCIKVKKINLGDLAAPGQTLLILERDPTKIRVELPGKYFSKIQVGTELKVLIDNEPNPIIGKVIEKSSGLDVNSQTFTVKIKIPLIQNLKSGTLAKVIIPEKRRALYVPTKAIIKHYDFTGIFVVKPNKVLELRYVKLGEVVEDRVEVLSGVKAGESIIVEGQEKACNGCILE